MSGIWTSGQRAASAMADWRLNAQVPSGAPPFTLILSCATLRCGSYLLSRPELNGLVCACRPIRTSWSTWHAKPAALN